MENADRAYSPGRADASRTNPAPTAPSDTVDNMINLLNHPISELHSALERLKMINNRLSGPTPPTAVSNTGSGEIRKEPHMLMKFAEKHSEMGAVVAAIHAQLSQLENTL